MEKVNSVDAKLAMADMDAGLKYPHYIKGSARRIPGNQKIRARVRCTKAGCGEEREVFTSDIFQTPFCISHQVEAKIKTKAEASVKKATEVKPIAKVG